MQQLIGNTITSGHQILR